MNQPIPAPPSDGSGAGYQIGDVARLLGVSAGTIRSWEANGLVSPQRNDSNKRIYTDGDVARLRQIKYLRAVKDLSMSAIRRSDLLEGDQTVSPARQNPSIGASLRTARKRAGLRLKDVAERSGYSVSFLSALERGVAGASITVTNRLKFIYFGDKEVGTDHSIHVQRVGMGACVDVDESISIEWLSNLPGLMEPQIYTVQPGGGSRGTYEHGGEEFILVLSGTLCMDVADARHVLGTGDSLHFMSYIGHSWENTGNIAARILWVTTERASSGTKRRLDQLLEGSELTNTD